MCISNDDNKLLTSSFNGETKVWNVRTGELLFFLNGHTNSITLSILTNDNKKVITVSDDYTVIIWDL